jgi:hypothetical protein
MLVGRNANHKVRNDPFERKLEVYRQDATARELAINADVLEAREWTPEAIQAREDRLLDIARAMWSLEGKVDRKL